MGLVQDMERFGCRHIHDYIAMPLIPIVQEIGLRGIPIDLELRQAMLESLTLRLGAFDARIEREYKLTDLNSDMKLGTQLKAMGVPLTVRTPKGQWKMDAEVLGDLNWRQNVRDGKNRFPFIPDLLKRSKLSKAKENVGAIVPCYDGLLRTALKACHTKTARYASAGFGRKGKPGYCPVCLTWGEHGTNLQNITRGCALCGDSPAKCQCEGGGVHLKSLFVAAPGWRLGEWDYSGLELRVMAYLIRCRLLAERLEQGVDLHTLHARLMFPGLDITKKRRTLAKNFIYAIRGAGGNRAVQIVLAKAGEYVEQHEIETWRRAIFAEYPEIPAWIDETDALLRYQRKHKQDCVVYNAFGRPRILLGHEPLKEALAYKVSGTAADIMNCVAVRLAYEQPDVMARIPLQIHDSWMAHAPESEFGERMEGVREEMERPVWQWDAFVKYPAEGKAGNRWSELHEWPS